MATSKRTAFNVAFDVSAIEGLAKKLASLDKETIVRVISESTNESADLAYDLSRKTMLAGINLNDAYVQRKMQVVHATPAKPEALIVAFGDKPNLTGLSHYGAMVKTQSVLHPSRSRGNSAAGIPAGSKSDGVSVEVIRGKRESFKHGFFLPGKIDSEGNPLMFARKKDTGKIVSRRGPAVYMLFRVASGRVEEPVYGDLGTRLLEKVEEEFQKALT